MFERCTERARRAVFFARYEVSFQPRDKITAEHFLVITTGHLLVGIIREGDLRLSDMGSLKDHEEHLRSVLDIPAHKGKAVWDLKKDIPLDQNAKVALAYAAKEADFDEEYWIDTDHLLRGILSFPNEASAALQSIFINLDQARIASKSHRAECPAEKSLYHRLFGSPFRAHRVTLAKWLISIFVALLGLLIIRWIN